MAGLAPVGSQFDARQYDARIAEILRANGEDILSFEAMGWQEKMLWLFYPTDFMGTYEIQQRPSNRGVDVIQQVRYGTGKTATFCSGVQQQLDNRKLQKGLNRSSPNRKKSQRSGLFRGRNTR
ncbi:eukaryotic initiation factor 4A-13-like [Cornus florida]|uniref:eukaryotic initiation factor 4A-13-like n=1 Tax=Cornus florida TaxID=4283 RepID=UPI00289C199E|nr:eukaryotic initiation factor 4A-13-like [Cornus florida]